MDWVAWHAAYDDPSSPLSERLRRVRSHLSSAIDNAPTGRVSLVSLCAGQGHDVLGVLPQHPRRDDVRAVLVEADARNVGLARRAAAGQGLSQVEVRQADAGVVGSFAESGFEEIAFDVLDTGVLSVGVNRLRRGPANTLPDERLFTFRAALPGPDQVKPMSRTKCPSLRLSTPPPAQ